MVRGAHDVTRRLQALYVAKARAEIAAADLAAGVAPTVGMEGDPMAAVALVTGVAGALPDPTRTAAVKALEALGFDPVSVCVVYSRPGAGLDGAGLIARLRGVVEAVDPVLVLAIDPPAAHDVSLAFETASLSPGVARSVGGRTLGAIGDLGASLDDRGAKSAVWAAFRAVAAAVSAATKGDRPRSGAA